MTQVIKPTVGRVLHFYPHASDSVLGEPLAAIVSKVLDDTHVNLCVLYADGSTNGRQGVYLRQPAAAKLEQGGYCEWPAGSYPVNAQSAPPVGGQEDPTPRRDTVAAQGSVSGASG